MNFKSVNDVLDFAIKSEIEAARFYTDLAAKIES
jgi:rubrerythrin